jgi:hypothetical protein
MNRCPSPIAAIIDESHGVLPCNLQIGETAVAIRKQSLSAAHLDDRQQRATAGVVVGLA